MTPTLPHEVWSHVFAHISHGKAMMDDDYERSEEGSARYHVLSNLCLVSKTFKHLAEPFLYNSFTPRYGHSLVWWAHTVLLDPRLSKYVHQIEFSPLDDFKESRNLANEPRHTFCSELARSLNISDDNASLPWSEFDDSCATFRGRMWLLLQILLVKLPNLEKVMIYTPSPAEFPHFWTKTSLPPPNIRELRVEWNDGLEEDSRGYLDDEIGVDISALGGLLALPKLEKLHLVQFVGSSSRDQFGEPRTAPVQFPTNEALTWLRCGNSLIDRDTIHKLATAFPNLEIFEYQAGFIGCFDGAPDPSFGSDIVLALTPLAAKLKTLNLHCARQDNWPTLCQNPRYPIPSLTAFECLENLDVDMMLILRRKAKLSAVDVTEPSASTELENEDDENAENAFYDYLPPNLKSLTITHAVDKLISPLTKLSNNVNFWLPHLEKIRWQFGTGVIDDDDLVKRLGEMHPGEATIKVKGWPIPGRYVRIRRSDDGSDEYDTSLDITLLPPLWRTITETFVTAGIRVKIGHGFEPATGGTLFEGVYWTSQPFDSWLRTDDFIPAIEFDDEEQKGVWKWQPSTTAVESPLYDIPVLEEYGQFSTEEFNAIEDWAIADEF